MKNTTMIVINAESKTYAVPGRIVKIGALSDCFAVTPNHDYFGGRYVLTHLASGLAVPGSSAFSITETIRRAKQAIREVGEEKYCRVVQAAIDKHGAHIADAYRKLK